MSVSFLQKNDVKEERTSGFLGAKDALELLVNSIVGAQVFDLVVLFVFQALSLLTS